MAQPASPVDVLASKGHRQDGWLSACYCLYTRAGQPSPARDSLSDSRAPVQLERARGAEKAPAPGAWEPRGSGVGQLRRGAREAYALRRVGWHRWNESMRDLLFRL